MLAACGALAVRLCVMSLCLALFEQLAPGGALRRTVRVGLGLVFLSYAITEIVGIFERTGV